jgi:hypothetical protein
MMKLKYHSYLQELFYKILRNFKYQKNKNRKIKFF